MSIDCGVKKDSPYVVIKGPVTISLPLPDDVSSELSINWEQADMGALKAYSNGAAVNDMSAVKETAKGTIQGVKMMARKAGWGLVGQSKLAEKRAGGILNANEEMLYTGTNFRRYGFSWTLYPTNKTYAENISLAVRNFYKYSVGELSEGRIKKYPSPWRIHFVGTELVPNISKFNVAITNVSANFSVGSGIVLHKDGLPVKTNISLSFSETTIRTQQDF